MKYIVLFSAAVGLSYLYNMYTLKTLLAIVPAIPVALMIIFFTKDLEKNEKRKERG